MSQPQPPFDLSYSWTHSLPLFSSLSICMQRMVETTTTIRSDSRTGRLQLEGTQLGPGHNLEHSPTIVLFYTVCDQRGRHREDFRIKDKQLSYTYSWFPLSVCRSVFLRRHGQEWAPLAEGSISSLSGFSVCLWESVNVLSQQVVLFSYVFSEEQEVMY